MSIVRHSDISENFTGWQTVQLLKDATSGVLQKILRDVFGLGQRMRDCCLLVKTVFIGVTGLEV